MASITQPFFTQSNGIAVPVGDLNLDNVFRLLDVDPTLRYDNRGAMFYKLLNMLGSPQAYNQVRYEFVKDTRFKTETTPSTDYDNVVTTIVVSDSGIILPRSIIRNAQTGEHMLVTAVSGASLTVVRGYQGTTAAAVTAATDKIVVLQTALPEGADAGEGVAKVPTQDYNYISFFSERMSETDVQAVADMLNSVGTVPQQMRDYIDRLTTLMDNDIRWGIRNVDTTSYAGKPIYTGGGFDSTVVSNDITFIGDLAWQDFNDEFNAIFDLSESSAVKWLLVDPVMFDKINKVPWDNYTVGNSVPQFDEVLGEYIKEIQLSGGGKVKVMRDAYGFRSLSNATTGAGFLIDPAYINLTQYSGFDMVIRDITQPESHTKETELFGSCGLKIPREEHHATITWSAT
jgi:hypothetical protein